MTFTKSLMAVVIAAGVAVTVGAPANAVVSTFATFSAASAARNIRFVNSGDSLNRLVDATIYTTSTGSSTIAGAAAVKFSFLIPQLAPYVTDINALYTLNGSIAKGSPVAGITTLVQGGYGGTFSLVTTTAITIDGPNFVPHTFAAGSNLLSGTFSGGTFVGNFGASAGSSFASGPAGATISYTSDFLDFTNVALLDRATSLTAVNPTFSRHVGINGALSTFRAVSGGQFSSDPAPLRNFAATVPEPNTWALLVIGFGMVGATLRRRYTAVI